VDRRCWIAAWAPFVATGTNAVEPEPKRIRLFSSVVLPVLGGGCGSLGYCVRSATYRSGTGCTILGKTVECSKAKAFRLPDKLRVTTAICVAVLAWSACCFYFPLLIGKSHVPRSLRVWVPTISVVGAILLILNWRLDRWLAVILGSDLTGAHRFLPMWIIHLSTLVLVIWIGVLVILTRPAGCGPKNIL
jgi:hypothetical protein